MPGQRDYRITGFPRGAPFAQGGSPAQPRAPDGLVRGLGTLTGMSDASPENAAPAPGPGAPAAGLAGVTAWEQRGRPSLREFLRTQTGSAAVLLGATVLALLWANIDEAGYHHFWATEIAVQVGDHTLTDSLHEWVNSGLMTFFFFVVGLETRREFDLGELRERRQVVLPVVAGVAGMVLPIAIYLAVTAGDDGAHGWGAAMSTDTAFALGVLDLLGKRVPDAVRTFILTVSVVDDVCALAVIAVFYSESLRTMPLLVAGALLAAAVLTRAIGVRRGWLFVVLGVAMWTATHLSGVDPIVVGLVLGLLTYARPAARDDLERASDLFRRFREEPTAELARSARAGVWRAISPNDRLQQLYYPWTGYVIVPLFALANAGVVIDAQVLADAARSPVTIGIVLGSAIGKPLGLVAGAWLTTRLTRGRLRPPVGWASVLGGGTISGIGFTVSLLVATLAFSGPVLEEAKVGILAAAVWASLVTGVLFRVVARLPKATKVRLLFGGGDALVDLVVPVDVARDHIRGPLDAPVTLVEYGDFECPHCGRAEPVVRELLAEWGDVRYVWRHLPLTDVHPRAKLAAEAAEAAADQGAFWEMHDLLFRHQDALGPRDLVRYAAELGLDVERFSEDLRRHAGAGRVADDLESADLANVSGTPTFFVNGVRHYGAYDITALSTAVRTARARALLAPAPEPA
jgi:Na+/H+ antiporter NhaA